MYKEKSIAVVFPPFNEGTLAKHTLDFAPFSLDKVYVVDDASTDTTLSVMLAWAERESRIGIIACEANGGVGAAIVSGYKMALKNGIDIAAVMAGDGKMDPHRGGSEQ